MAFWLFATKDKAAILSANAMMFVSSCIWGSVVDRIGRRWAMVIPAVIGIFVTPFYLGLFTTSYPILVLAFTVRGFFAGSLFGQNPSYLSERFPTELRATAAGFCSHQGLIWGWLCQFFVLGMAGQFGLAVPIFVTTTAFLLVFIVAVLLGPETKGKVLVSAIEYRDLSQAPSQAVGL